MGSVAGSQGPRLTRPVCIYTQHLNREPQGLWCSFPRSVPIISQMQDNVPKVSGDRIRTNEIISGNCFELSGATERQGALILKRSKKRRNSLRKLRQKEGRTSVKTSLIPLAFQNRQVL